MGTSADASESAATASSSTGGPTSTDGDDGPLLDIGAADTTASAEGGMAGCEKVDFLFVIDNSSSMLNEQEKLIASFPEFMSAIVDAVDVSDFRVMVVDTSGGASASQNTGTCTGAECCIDWCLNNPSFPKHDCSESGGPVLTCAEHISGEPPTLCDETFGAGRLLDGMTYATCDDLSQDQRYLDSSLSEAELQARFSCAARVGIHGLFQEASMDAMVQAVAEAQGSGCNEGFVRDDAILVVTFITDTADEYSPGTPQSWRQALLDVKGGNEDAVVVLGVFGDGDLPTGVCEPFGMGGQVGAAIAPLQREFVDSFDERGFFCSVCADGYAPCFADAVDVIDSACDDFVPVD